MSFILKPGHLFFSILVGLVNHQAERVISFQNAQIRVLLTLLGRKRLLLTDPQRCLLAVKGKALGRKAMLELTTIVTPETILRWHRKLIAEKWNYCEQRKSNPGRPKTADQVTHLIIQCARENPSWGYTRIRGALSNLGHNVSDSTIASILKAEGVEPAPDRPTQWKTFLNAHWNSICSIDFTTIEVWTKSGLVTFYILVAMHLKTRKVEIVGITEHPEAKWTKQMARNLTDSEDGFLKEATHLIVDRDTSFLPLRTYIENTTDIQVMLLPPKSPNLNAHLERFMRSMKSECLSKMIFFGQRPLERALNEFTEHYHGERNHQGLDNLLIDPTDEPGREVGAIACRERLGGLLKFYYREAA